MCVMCLNYTLLFIVGDGGGDGEEMPRGGDRVVDGGRVTGRGRGEGRSFVMLVCPRY